MRILGGAVGAGWRVLSALAPAVATLAALGGGLAATPLTGCGRQPICVPDCMGRVCGDDGCGGSCGACEAGELCAGGQCLCVPDCAGRWCGDDGCGGSCGVCPAFTACEQGACVCAPSCLSDDGMFTRSCGDDGCGGSCGSCAEGTRCVDGVCCAPDCFGRQCGDDGCGGSCGACAPGTTCVGGACACVPSCETEAGTKECGDDGCGGSCGACGPGERCLDGACCAPNCAGRWCGDDGCGGSCGACRDGVEECVTGPGPVAATCSVVDAQCDALASPGSAADQCADDEDCASGERCVSVCGVRQCTCTAQADCSAPASVCHPAVWPGYASIEGPSVWTCTPPCDPLADAPDAPCPTGAHCQPMYVWLDGAAPGTTNVDLRDVCAQPLRMDCLSCGDASDCVLAAYECMRSGDTVLGSCLRPCDPGCPEGTQCSMDWVAEIEACYPPSAPCGPH